jgi:hypothetical protein
MASEDDRSVDTESSVAELSDLATSFLDCISDIHTAGSFAAFGSFDNFVPPGVVVDEIGAVRLLPSSDDAQSLIRASRQAPFGKETRP